MTDLLNRLERNLDYRSELINRHLAKAQQCVEYKKFEDADVHLKIATILNQGAPDFSDIYEYEKQSLNNLAQSL